LFFGCLSAGRVRDSAAPSTMLRMVPSPAKRVGIVISSTVGHLPSVAVVIPAKWISAEPYMPEVEARKLQGAPLLRQ
jgi:hypothetical protein